MCVFEDRHLEKMIKAFCKNVKLIRELKKITQNELALKSNLAVNTIAEIEQKRIENLRLSTVSAIGLALEVNPIKLLQNK